MKSRNLALACREMFVLLSQTVLDRLRDGDCPGVTGARPNVLRVKQPERSERLVVVFSEGKGNYGVFPLAIGTVKDSKMTELLLDTD